MRVFLRTKKKNCSVTRNHFGLAGPTGDSKGTWVFLNTFSKAIQPRFYELRKIWDMTLTWIFLVQTSRTCLGEMFPKLVISRFSWNNKSFLEQQNIHQKKKSPSTSKRTQVSKKKNFIPSFFGIFFHPFEIPGQLFVHLNTCWPPPGVRHPEIGHSDPESAAEHHRHHGLHIGLDLGTRLLLPRSSRFPGGKAGKIP